MEDYDVRLGVSEDKILLDYEVSINYENTLLIKDIVEENNFKSVIVVTYEYY